MYKNIAAITNLSDATVTGLVFSTLIFIAIKEEPQIALNVNNKNKLLDKILLIRKYYFLFLGIGRMTFS